MCDKYKNKKSGRGKHFFTPVCVYTYIYCIKIYLHDFGPDCAQHVLQTLRYTDICATVHMIVHWDDLKMTNTFQRNENLSQRQMPIFLV